MHASVKNLKHQKPYQKSFRVKALPSTTREKQPWEESLLRLEFIIHGDLERQRPIHLYLFFSALCLCSTAICCVKVLKTLIPASVSPDEGVGIDYLKTTNEEKDRQNSKDLSLILSCHSCLLLPSLSGFDRQIG